MVCNADEGDSGTFADRMLMEGDPFLLIEGMIIAGIAVGASKGYIYVRSEYPDAIGTLNEALRIAREAGYLGANVGGSGRPFELDVRVGAGAYICGEETALLESLEGKRGTVRAKPPLPALQGLFGLPTLVHNVLTLASVPIILEKGAQFYRDFGMGRSLGTMPFQLAGNVRQAGLVERAFGLSLRELVEGYGGGTASGRPLKAAQVGGPLGAWVPPRSSIRRWTMRRSPPWARCSATVAWWLPTTAWTWPTWPVSPCSSAPRNPAASARRAGLARPVGWRWWTA